jgi:hypothetical protein
MVDYDQKTDKQQTTNINNINNCVCFVSCVLDLKIKVVLKGIEGARYSKQSLLTIQNAPNATRCNKISNQHLLDFPLHCTGCLSSLPLSSRHLNKECIKLEGTPLRNMGCNRDQSRSSLIMNNN